MRTLTTICCLLLTACAAPMSSFHTGRTTPRNRVELMTGIGLNVASSFVSSVIDAGKTAADKAKEAITQGQTPTLSEDETRDLMQTAFAYGLLNPTPLWELGLRYGILDRWDAGVAYTTSGFRFESRVQLLRENLSKAKPGQTRIPLDLSIGVQVMKLVFSIPIPDFLKDVFSIEDLSRLDLAVPVVLGRHFGQYGFVYGGPKFVYSFLQADVLEKLSDLTGRTVTTDKGMWAVGGVVGGGIGYKYVFAVLELNVLYYDYRPTILDTEVNLSGVNVYPALGLKVNFFSPG